MRGHLYLLRGTLLEDVPMSAELLGLLCAIERVVPFCASAVDTWGPDSRTRHNVEELAELIIELMREPRGRSSAEAIIGEAADVIITTIQVAMLFGGANWHDALSQAIDAKREKLVARLPQAE